MVLRPRQICSCVQFYPLATMFLLLAIQKQDSFLVIFHMFSTTRTVGGSFLFLVCKIVLIGRKCENSFVFWVVC
jgi:hypothetical protein